MSRILAIDLGKFKSVTCLLETDTNATEFWTMATERHYLETVLKRYAPDLVVIESCSLAGWVHDVCTAEGYEVLVCNPNQEAWKWRHVKRKTDRDDALKLAKLAALEQLVPVYIPRRQQREYPRLVKYRQVVLGRVNRVQNNIRSIFAQRGMEMMRGQKAWALERYQEISQHRKPLAECSLDDLWRGELDLELSQLEHLRQRQHEIHKQLQALSRIGRNLPRVLEAMRIVQVGHDDFLCLAPDPRDRLQQLHALVRARDADLVSRGGTPSPCCSARAEAVSSPAVSDLVDYSSCRRLFLFPAREFSSASSQEFIQRGCAAHSFDRSR